MAATAASSCRVFRWIPSGPLMGRFFVYSGADIGTTFPLRGGRPGWAALSRCLPDPDTWCTQLVFRLTGRSLVACAATSTTRTSGSSICGPVPSACSPSCRRMFVIGDFDIAPDGSESSSDRVQDDFRTRAHERAPSSANP